METKHFQLISEVVSSSEDSWARKLGGWESLQKTGNLVDVNVQELMSSVWAARWREGSEALRLILGSECCNSSMEERICGNSGLSSFALCMESATSLFIALGQFLYSLLRSGIKHPRPTKNMIWSLSLIWEYGSSPVINSYRTMPYEYTSDWKLNGLLSCIRMTSGAIHRIDPVGCSTCWEPLHRDLTVARPKSPIFTVSPSCKNILFDFMSLWMIFFACK